MPDAAASLVSTHDSQSKMKIKGEIVNFLIKTAFEFTTRQTRTIEIQPLVAVELVNFSIKHINGRYERCVFENDKHLVFMKPARSKSSNDALYFYFRATDNHWVIDNIMEPRGAVFSSSSTDDFNGLWITPQTRQSFNTASVKQVKHVDGFNGEAIEISGMNQNPRGGSLTGHENGTY